MNVEITMQHLFDNYPGVFKDRADCLNQFFCSIGNGYYWKNGELVWYDATPDEIKQLESRLVNGKAFQHNKLSLRDESIYYAVKRAKKRGITIPENVMDMFDSYETEYFNSLPDDVYYDEPNRYKRWSFYYKLHTCEYVSFSEMFAYLFNYPDDIKPDWKAALDECREMLIQDGYTNLPDRRIAKC